LEHRPMVLVRGGTLTGDVRDAVGKPEVSLQVVNTGASQANVVLGSFGIVLGPIRPFVPLGIVLGLKTPFVSLDELTLRPGQSYHLSLELSDEVYEALKNKYAVSTLGRRRGPTIQVSLIGTIRYNDGQGTQRTTNICRAFEASHQRFVPRSIAEGEYAE
jgi:hypothetical protein